MYFGYATMWTFRFVPIAFVIVMTVGIALAFVYVVGATRGKAAAARYTRAWGIVLVAAIAADLVYGALTGQLTAFLAVYGWTPVIEMGLLAAMFIGSMWMMATSYLRERRPSPSAGQGNEVDHG